MPKISQHCAKQPFVAACAFASCYLVPAVPVCTGMYLLVKQKFFAEGVVYDSHKILNGVTSPCKRQSTCLHLLC